MSVVTRSVAASHCSAAAADRQTRLQNPIVKTLSLLHVAVSWNSPICLYFLPSWVVSVKSMEKHGIYHESGPYDTISEAF